MTSDGGGGEGSMRNDRKQPRFRLSHLERADRPCVTLTFLLDHPHIPSSSSGSLGRIVCCGSSAGSSSALALPAVKREASEGGTSGNAGLEMTVKMMRRDSRPDRGDGPTSGPEVFQYLGQRQFAG